MSKKGWQISAVIVGVAILIFTVPMFNRSFNETGVAVADIQAGTLVVNGVGEVNAEPDMATVHLGAQATAQKADEAQGKVNERINAINKVLKEYGVDDKDVQTAYFNVYPYNVDENGQNVEKYRSEHMLEIEFKEIDRLGEFIDAASKAGANQMNQIRFGLQDSEKFEHEALQKAIEKTKAKADVMATSAGKKRGNVIQVSDQAAQINFPFADQAAVEQTQNADASSSMAIETGEVKIVQRVDVVYELN